MIGIKNFEEALKKAYFRKYDLYYVSFIKHRQLKEREFRNFGKATALYRQYKKRYKSAAFRVSVSPVHQADKLFNQPNPFLKLIPKSDDFVGKRVSTPIEYSDGTGQIGFRPQRPMARAVARKGRKMRKQNDLEKLLLYHLKKIFPKTKVVRVFILPGLKQVDFSATVFGNNRGCSMALDVVERALTLGNDAYIRDTVLNMLEITSEQFNALKSWQIQAPPEYYEERKRTRITRGQERRARQLKIFNGG